MQSGPFTHVDEAVLVDLIEAARERLVFVAPGVHFPVAEALVKAMQQVPAEAIHIVLDIDAEVCRLGYGDADFKGVEALQSAALHHGLTINHHPGVRIGLLIADEATLVYSPVARLIEAGSHQADKPNGILLEAHLPPVLADACGLGPEGAAALAVGQDPIQGREIAHVKEDLAARPPKQFDLARIERVFNSLLHYVEWEISDYKLASRAIKIRPELFGVRHAEVVSRMTNRYRLFAKVDALIVEIPAFGEGGQAVEGGSEKFGPQSIDLERQRIKKRFLFSGGDFGLLILRRDVPEFERQLKRLGQKIAAYQSAVQALVAKRCDEIVSELINALKDSLKANPPEHWQSRIAGGTITDDEVKRLFEEDIRAELKRVQEDFDPHMFKAYKDVTYQTFQSESFRKSLEKRFGKNAMNKLFSEHDAAPENPS